MRRTKTYKGLYMFKGFATATMIAAAGLMVMSCGKGKEEASSSAAKVENVTLTVWESTNGPDEFIKQAGAKFHETHQNVDIKYVNVELGDAIGQIALDGPAGKGPDVFAAPHDRLGTLVSGGHVLPTSNPDEVRAHALGACSTALTYGGTMYGYPVSAETYAMFYNKALISEDELPKTWEDLAAFAKKFNENNPGKYGFVMDVGNSYYTIIFTTADGNRLYGADGTDSKHSNINSPAAVKGMEFFQSLRDALPVPAAGARAERVSLPVQHRGGLSVPVRLHPARTRARRMGGAAHHDFGHHQGLRRRRAVAALLLPARVAQAGMGGIGGHGITGAASHQSGIQRITAVLHELVGHAVAAPEQRHLRLAALRLSTAPGARPLPRGAAHHRGRSHHHLFPAAPPLGQLRLPSHHAGRAHGVDYRLRRLVRDPHLPHRTGRLHAVVLATAPALRGTACARVGAVRLLWLRAHRCAGAHRRAQPAQRPLVHRRLPLCHRLERHALLHGPQRQSLRKHFTPPNLGNQLRSD